MTKKENKFWSIGEIHRQGLLKNTEGEPYKQKRTISNIVNKLKYATIDTPYGTAKCLSLDQIEEHNKKYT